MTPHTVAVVGAGFSGVMTAAHLLRSRPARPIRVVTVNRSGRSARGVAYGTNSPHHLLNVPAGRMSAFPDEPTHFADFARRRDPGVTPATFVRRSVYGEYLEAILAEAAGPGPNWLERLVGEVRSVRPDGVGAVLRLADGADLVADHVVLAVGHYPPTDPPGLPPAVTASRAYVRDPWARGSLADVPSHLPTLLVGTGLTMLDVAIDLKARGVPGVVAVSRRGLLPRPHDPAVPPADPSHRPAGLDAAATARGYLAAVRRGVRAVTAAGGDWRQVIDSLRPLTPALWQRLSDAEKARFLRRVRPYWEVHRHRAAPATAAAIAGYQAAGWLAVRAGTIRSAVLDGDGVAVNLGPRGRGEAELLRVGAVVNCTGPSADVSAANDPLLGDLFARGLARPDALGLGLAVVESGAVVGADGRPSDVLSYVGPLLRGRDGEGTAVPELRVHAARLAARLVAEIVGPT